MNNEHALLSYESSPADHKQLAQRPSRRLHIGFPDKEKGVFERRRDTVEAARTCGFGIGAGARYDRINAVQPTLLRSLMGTKRTTFAQSEVYRF
jgi:hypothetical protein